MGVLYLYLFVYYELYVSKHSPTSSSVGPVANATDVLQPSRLIVLIPLLNLFLA